MIDPKEKKTCLLTPVFALRRKDDLGIGDTESVKQCLDFCARNNFSILQILPINETSGDNSPYNAISSVALEPIYLSISSEKIPGLTKKDFESIVSNSKLKTLDQTYVHYPIVKKLKLELLSAAWDNFNKSLDQKTHPQVQDFLAFCQKNRNWLTPYTLFRTIVDKQNGNTTWTDWPKELQDFEKSEDWIKNSTQAESLSKKRLFYAYVQWLSFSQWKDLRNYADKLSIKLIGDIPFGISRFSSDVWSERKIFDLDWTIGAPPEPTFQVDEFTKEWGQNWGFPLYKWEIQEKDNYRWWRQRIQIQKEIFHYFRIDHILGFFRVYAFPWNPERNSEFTHLSQDEAMAKTKGELPKFLPRSDYPEELGKLNALDGKKILSTLITGNTQNLSNKNNEPINDSLIGEDLGTVPDYMRPLLRKMGIPGFAIPLFERHEEDLSYKKISELSPLNIATYATHDHMPLRAFYEDLVAKWHGPNGHEFWLEVQRLMKFLGLDENNPPTEFTDELHLAFLETLLKSPCWVAAFMITDVLGSTQQFNQPGLYNDSNWSLRLDRELLDYEQDSLISKKIKRLSELIQETGRI